MIIKTIQGEPYAQNTYILTIDHQIVIIDPGYNYQAIQAFLGARQPALILLTHFHFDHVASVNQLCEQYQIKAFLDQSEHEIVQRDTLATTFGFPAVHVAKKYLANFEALATILPSLKTFKAPGHSPGSTMFIFQNMIFSGDVIFASAIGKTTFLHSNAQAMLQTLRQIKNWPRHYLVYPGHGPQATLAKILQLPIFQNL